MEVRPSFALALAGVDDWDVEHVAAGVLGPEGLLASHGDISWQARIASVGKLLVAYAVLIGVEEGVVRLDDAAGPPGASLRHLLAHASGFGFESDAQILAPPGARRIYSNRGIEVAAAHLAACAGMTFHEYLSDALFVPLGMTRTELRGSPATSIWSTVSDLAQFAQELLRPQLLDATTLADAVSVQFPGLGGVLPGVGRFDRLSWGLGFEIRDTKYPHWTGTRNAAATFGHFGGAGTFLWVDPVVQRALVCLTDREFGKWALEAWPTLSDAVLAVAH